MVNIEYCVDCEMHLCDLCLKSRQHLMHRKNSLTEMKPLDEEKQITKNYINALQNQREELKQQKKEQSIDLYNNLINSQKNNKYKFYKFISNSNKLLKNKIFINKKKISE